MTAVALYLVGAAASVLLSWLLVRLLRGSLADLLTELWQSRARAAFWAAVGSTAILLLGVFGGTGTGGYPASGDVSFSRGFFAMASQMRSTLGGLFLALFMVAFAVAMFSMNSDRPRRGHLRGGAEDVTGPEA